MVAVAVEEENLLMIILAGPKAVGKREVMTVM